MAEPADSDDENEGLEGELPAASAGTSGRAAASNDEEYDDANAHEPIATQTPTQARRSLSLRDPFPTQVSHTGIQSVQRFLDGERFSPTLQPHVSLSECIL